MRRSVWPVRVFAVDDSSAQLTWRASPAEALRLEIGDLVAEPTCSPQADLTVSLVFGCGVPGSARAAGASSEGPATGRNFLGLRGRRLLDPAWPGGPGALAFDGLAPATTYDVVASARGVPRFLAARLRTLPAPDGRLLCRFATVSDVHIGEKHFGILGRLHDGQGARGDGQTNQTYAARALTAALEEAAAWGAELIVTKGDLTRRTAAAEVRDVGRLLAASSVPVETMLGNHDNQLGVNVRGVLASQGVRVPWRPTAVDLPGVRLVLANTPHSIPRHHNGQVTADVRRRVAELAGEAAATGTGVWVGLHHPPEMRPYPTVYPPGIPFDQSRALLSALAAAQPNTLVTCGHRHRNRRYGYGPLVISEVGSTKDYPGVWAGYKVFEGGVVQIVRRTSRPDVMAWTEGTRRAVNGQWQRWSPGRLEDRCFAVRWPLAP